MKLGKNLKQLREDKGYTQQEMADLMRTHRTGYSKMENDQQEISIDSLVLLASHFGITIDDILSVSNSKSIPQEITFEDKSSLEQLKLIQELEAEDKNMVFKLIDTFLTKKKFKDFFTKNIAAL